MTLSTRPTEGQTNSARPSVPGGAGDERIHLPPELAGHGAYQHHGDRGHDNVTPTKGGNDPTYLVRRMKRDAPEIGR